MGDAEGGGMPNPEPEKPFVTRLQMRLAQARFLTFSALIHTVIIVLGGSVVLFKRMAEPPDFTAGDGGLVSSEVTPAAPPEEMTPQMDQFTPTTPTLTAPPISVLVSNSSIPTAFNAPVAMPTARAGVSTGALDQAVEKAMKGAGRGLGTGMAGGTARFFGEKEKTMNGLTGTFYDTKQNRNRKPSEVTVEEYGKIMSKFVKENFRESVLNDYFKAPGTLSTTQIFIPNMPADEGPKAFEMEKVVQPSRWLVHYQGKVAPPQDGTYRFVGAGDDYLVVRFNGKLVLDHGFSKATEWEAEKYYDYGWTGVPKGFARGDKVRVKAGQFYDLEILIGEQPGGLVFFCLMLEEEGAEYKRDAKGNPILPVFRLVGGPFAELGKEQTLPPYEPEGPIWKAAPLKSGGTGFSELFSGK